MHSPDADADAESPYMRPSKRAGSVKPQFDVTQTPVAKVRTFSGAAGARPPPRTNMMHGNNKFARTTTPNARHRHDRPTSASNSRTLLQCKSYEQLAAAGPLNASATLAGREVHKRLASAESTHSLLDRRTRLWLAEE